MTALACPDETTLSRLTRGELDRLSSEAVFFHLQSCDSCSSALESLAPGWSRASLATPADALSTFTRDVQDRLAANPPSLPEWGSRSAAIPHAIPMIPGLADLEPRSRGGMGIVYRAQDIALRRPVAVKLLWPAAAGSETAWARAKREALVLARISHANVVAVYSAGETGGSPYLVMEWVDGPSLQQRIDAELPTPRQAARIVRDLARAVAAVHALGIVHRDIKPDNVLLAGPDAADWICCVPKLADFGLARPAELSQQLTQDASALGTPAYMAPEQTGLAADLGEPGPAADIHGLGGLAYALLTGSPPHQAATATASLQQAARSEITWPAASRRLPRDLRAIVSKCLERQPARRYASAALLADDLHRFVEGLPVRARPVSPLRRLARTVRRRPVLAAATVLSAVFAAAAAGGLAYHFATIASARTQLDRSEQLAEQTAGVAARSMDRLTGDLIEQMILRSRPDDTGHLEFLRQVREEFAGWPLGSDPAEALRFRIKGLERVAELFADVNRYDDALACHKLSLRSLDELAKVQPDDSALLEDRLAILQRERVCLHHLGRVDDAEASARAAAVLVPDASVDTPDVELQRIKLIVDRGIFLHQQQRFDEGAASIDEALAALRRLRKAHPNRSEVAAKEALTLFIAQQCAFQAGRLDECRQRLDQLAGTMEGLFAGSSMSAATPSQRSKMTKMFVVSFDLLARFAANEGRVDDAIKFLSRQRQLCRAFLADLPDDVIDPIHMQVIDADLRAADWLMIQDRDSEAAAAVEEAAEAAAFLFDRQPGVWEHAAILAATQQRRAELAVARGERSAAAEAFREMIALMEPQLAKPAHRQETEAFLATARAGLRDLGEDPNDALAPALTRQP